MSDIWDRIKTTLHPITALAAQTARRIDDGFRTAVGAVAARLTRSRA